MTLDAGNELPNEDRRKEIFRAIVDAQDGTMGVAQSRRLAVERFGVTDTEVLRIEREGMDKQWPPL